MLLSLEASVRWAEGLAGTASKPVTQAITSALSPVVYESVAVPAEQSGSPVCCQPAGLVPEIDLQPLIAFAQNRSMLSASRAPDCRVEQ